MSKHTKRYTFTLIGINIDRIDRKYGIAPVISTETDIVPNNTTKIDDLEVVRRTPEIVSFVDESKRLKKCTVSMIEFHTGRNVNLMQKYKCFWDREYIPENVQPIGCPIRYVPDKATKSYHSEISKERYTIVENVTSKKGKLLSKTDSRISIEQKNYYLTDGVFCSFNCCMAFIKSPEIRHNSFYKNSETLLLKMYEDITCSLAEQGQIHPLGHVPKGSNEDLEIMAAPDWRTLIEFGGHLNIDQFRDSFNKVKYIDHGIVCMSYGRLFEDQIRF